MGRGKGDMSQVILKIGLALAFSLGGMFCTFIKNRRIKPSSKSSDCDNQGISQRSSNGEHHGTPSSCQFDSPARDEHNSSSDNDSYLLPEFNDLVKEFDTTAIKMNPRLPIPDANSPPKVNSTVKTDSQEQEIKNLANMVKMLKERERSLEVQLLEYYGLKEQEATVIELQNRLKLNNMEAKRCALRIESLESENKRLESQMADYDKVLMDLEAARAKIKVLKKRLRSEAAQNKERILDLQQRVEKMQEDDHKRSVEIESKLCKLKDLEVEVNQLRKSNYNLQVEKAELTQRLEQVQILATSVLEDQESEKLRIESERLKKQNEELTKEIEQLQADRCSDVEELVYMRWINACLRYELRNCRPGQGKTMARDLSKTLSPESEQKAKRLILEYANEEGDGVMGINIPELDSDHWSSPESSNLTDSSELGGEPFVDKSSSRKSKNKFFRKFVKLIRGKDRNSPDHPRHARWRHVRDYNRHHSQYSHSRKSSYSDLEFHKPTDSTAEGFSGSPHSSDGQKSELVKYAEVLQDSNSKPPTQDSSSKPPTHDSSSKPPTKYRRRSTMFSSF